MQTSENINEIAAALAAAQGQFTGVSKDSSVNTGKYGYRYADLASYLDAIRQPMAANGLAIVQSPEIDNDRVTVTTMIVHASGQWLLSQLSMGVSDSRPQTLGGIITYCRRYALTAMLNLAAEDDDAQTEQAAKRQSSQPEPAISQTTFPDESPAGPMIPAQLRPWLLSAATNFANDAPLPEGWRKAITGHLNRLTGGDNGRHAFLSWAFEVQSSDDLSNGAWHALRAWLDIRKADDGKYYPTDLAAAEAKLAMAALTQTADPAEPF